MFTKLTDVQIKLAEQLLISVIKKEPTIYYEELASRIDPPIFHRHVGKNIGEISKLCHELGLPLLSAKVVNKDTNTAGAGFYPFYKMYSLDTKGLSERELFQVELKKIRECTKWYKLADHLEIELGLPRPNNDKTTMNNAQLEIRILPMSRKEEFPGWSIEDIQNKYFLQDLITYNGYYYYRTQGMDTPPGSIVLFQFDNAIIASAKLLKMEKYVNPIDDLYHGAYIFDVKSVDIFDPITYDELHNIDNEIKPFSQTKQKVEYVHLEKIQRLLDDKKVPIIAEELSFVEANLYTEGAKKQITVNAYERNYKARLECIKYHGDSCVICDFNFGNVYGDDFKGKIHVHHIKALAEIDGEYQIDPKNDLVPVCPNCHLALHAKGFNNAYSIDELKAIINK